ncbi:MAG: LLM class flavin-dependent oxidoreductase [Egibacteraceae bacterium]
MPVPALPPGDGVTFRGAHLTVEDARLYTRPEQPPDVLIAGSGKESLSLAADAADGFVAVEPEASYVEQFRSLSGDGRVLGQAPLSYDADEGSARKQAMRRPGRLRQGRLLPLLGRRGPPAASVTRPEMQPAGAWGAGREGGPDGI